MATRSQTFETIEGALGALAVYLRYQALGNRPDPHVARIVLRSGESIEASIRAADAGSITLKGEMFGPTRRIAAADIARLAVALPAPRRWLTVALGTATIGLVFVSAVAVLHNYLKQDSVLALMLVVGVAAL